MSAFGLLLGEKRTSRGVVVMSVFDPLRHFATVICCIAKGAFGIDAEVSIF